MYGDDADDDDNDDIVSHCDCDIRPPLL